jgi:hypothetical protein
MLYFSHLSELRLVSAVPCFSFCSDRLYLSLLLALQWTVCAIEKKKKKSEREGRGDKKRTGERGSKAASARDNTQRMILF